MFFVDVEKGLGNEFINDAAALWQEEYLWEYAHDMIHSLEDRFGSFITNNVIGPMNDSNPLLKHADWVIKDTFSNTGDHDYHVVSILP